MKRHNEKGAALILALILVFVLSVMAVSLMFLSQSETWSSMNYRLMTQARYGAEAGLNAAANYLSNIYVGPPSATDPTAAYNTTTWPVQSNGQVVHLSNIQGDQLPPIYPDPGVVAAFNQNSQGTVQSGPVAVNYNASATLLSMYQVTVFDTGLPATIQTWQITSTGSIGGIRNAQVQVSAILERDVGPTFQYATFGKSNGCGSLTFGGGAYTNSYDSANVVGGVVGTQNYLGNVGSNGNLNEVGNPTTINGTLSTPRTGVGACSAGGVDAWSNSGNAQVTGCVAAPCTPCPPSFSTNCGYNRLPQNVKYPTPTIPPPGTTNMNVNNTQSLPPGSYGDIVMNGHGVLNLYPGVYNINSINDSGANTMIVINPVPGSIPPVYGPVILNVAGNGISTPVSLTGNSLQNQSLVAANFQIVYAGTGNIAIRGGSQAAGVVYAPNAAVSLSGGSDWYGSVIGNTVQVQGGTGVHYDRELNKTAYTLGNWMLDSFTWSKF